MIDKFFAALMVGLLSSVMAGCGNSNPLGRQPISGSVQLDGQPMDAGSISFRPKGKSGIGSGGPIREGSYQVEVAKGLPPGEYIVRVSSPLRFGDKKAPAGLPGPESLGMINGMERVPEEYNSKSTCLVTVTADGPNVFDYDIKAKKDPQAKQ